MKARQRSKKDPIPQFATREEAAAFWDTHDFSDYWYELEPANVSGRPGLASSIQITLDGKSLTQIYQYADAKGVDAETLIRQWIIDGLQALATD